MKNTSVKIMPRPRGKQLPNRLCVSFDKQAYADICVLSRESGVSVAWMVRRAVKELVSRHKNETLQSELPLQGSASTRRGAVA